MTETIETPAPSVDDFADDPVLSNLFAMLQTHTTNLKEANSKLLDGDPETKVDAYLRDTDDTEIQKLRAQVDKIMAKMRDIAMTKVGDVLSEDEKTVLTVQAETAGTGIAKIKKALGILVEDHDRKDDIITLMDSIVGKKSRVAGSSNAGGSTLPRANVILNVQKPGDDHVWVLESFSKAKQTLKWDVEEIGRAFAAAAGVEYDAISAVDKPVEFEFKGFLVKTTPKEVQRRGRKAKDAEGN